MRFTFSGEPEGRLTSWFAQKIRPVMEQRGHQFIEAGSSDEVKLVFNFISAQRPRPFRRNSQGTFVVSVVEVEAMPEDVLRAAYPILVRALSNLLIYLVPDGEGFATFFVTLEQGYYAVPFIDEASYFTRVYERLSPLASSTLVVNNEFVPDLPEELWNGNEVTAQLYEAGKRLDALDLLPAPFPIQELLPEQDFRHVRRLYGIGGLSYGNLSARHDASRFWMSASGVDKSNLRIVGQDILLVSGYDPQHNAMRLSVPPNITPRRVSVDAIEHWMIYTEHPSVGAIVHVHAWMEGVPSTQMNYPCGTYELAQAVAEEVRRAPDPSRAVVGLRNHGLTITGRSLADIFDRIEGRIIRQVPMS